MSVATRTQAKLFPVIWTAFLCINRGDKKFRFCLSRDYCWVSVLNVFISVCSTMYNLWKLRNNNSNWNENWKPIENAAQKRNNFLVVKFVPVIFCVIHSSIGDSKSFCIPSNVVSEINLTFFEKASEHTFFMNMEKGESHTPHQSKLVNWHFLFHVIANVREHWNFFSVPCIWFEKRLQSNVL